MLEFFCPRFRLVAALALLVLFSATPRAGANVAGGIIPSVTNNVTLVNNNNGTVTLGNGVISLLCTTSGAVLNQINYTCNNTGSPVTRQLLNGGTDGGMFYWELGGFGSGSFNYSVAVDPASTGGQYGEIDMITTSATNGYVDVHFALVRGSPGFYVTAIWNHGSNDGAFAIGETRDNIYAGSIFNWMCVDATRNRLMSVSPGSVSIPVLNAPKEVSLWTNGIYQGQYEDKYKYSANFGNQKAWGWCSVGSGGANVGLWCIASSMEYYNGGPMKRELMCHIGTTILNMMNGSHYGGGDDGGFAAGESWTKVYGPFFIYCNNVTNTINDPVQVSQALYADALAQAEAERAAWPSTGPYAWFTNASYSPASARGVITGQMAINDPFSPNASASNLWVGVVQTPSTTDGVYDFQEWTKAYQFWVKTGSNGIFTISNVIAGANYILYSFGPGAAGTFQSQALPAAATELDFPASPFSLTVTAGATNNLGVVPWTPLRVGPTVFEIGYPSRMGDKFRHGDDFWVGDIGPSPTEPSPLWTKHLYFPFDYPDGLNYVVGESRWPFDWNYVQPVVTDDAGNFDPSTSTITFNLASAPASNSQASFYIALSSDYQGPLIVNVNNNNLSGANGYGPYDSGSDSGSDTTIREGVHGIFSDNRLNFAGNLLHAGQNTITINMRKGGYFANHAMYDYLRLELTGYVPPSPASVAAFPGNNCNLLTWPVTPGACSYKIFSSTNSGGGFALIATNVIGPVCGSGPGNAVYLDTNAVNGATYYYTVQSVNPAGASVNSASSAGVSPSASALTNAPAAPTSLACTVSHATVNLAWNAASGANYYTLLRSTVVSNGGGSWFALSTNTLSNFITNTSYTDTSVSDGSTYSYTVVANGAGGISGNSNPIMARPLPAAPASAPGSLTASSSQTTNVILNWSSVSGAVGYIVQRATSTNGPFAYLMSVTETTYADIGLNTDSENYYTVTAVNDGGVSPAASVAFTTPSSAPALTAVPGNAQVTLTWTAVPFATNYVLQISTNSGVSYTTLVTTTNTGYVNTGIINGDNYYYQVYSLGPNGQSPPSPAANATPFASGAGIYWVDPVTSSPQGWNVNSNWSTGTGFPSGVQSSALIAIAIAATQTIDLNQAITLGALSIGATNGGASFIVAAGGGALTFDNSPGTASLVQLSTSAGDTISAPVIINGGLSVLNAATNALTFSGNISGAELTFNGNATLSGSNSYTGGTVVDSGKLVFSVGSAIPATGTLALYSNAAVSVITANSLPNVQVNGSNTITGNGNSGTGIGLLNDVGTLTLTISGGSSVFDLTGAMTGAGTLFLGSSAMTLRFNGTAGDGAAIFNLGNGAALANVRSTTTTAIALGGLTGGSGTQLQGDNSSGGANMTYTIGAANTNTEFDGLIKNGSVGTVALVKTGGGALTLTGSNTYSAGTTINGGLLVVNNTNGSATGSGPVTVASGGALGGSGIISGAVTLNSGGAFVPGNPLGVLTLGSALTLNAGSVTKVQVQHSLAANNAAIISGAFTEGGTLTVTNGGGSALAAGDHFALFNASIYGGAFSNFNLPALNSGLAWKTSRLTVDGSLWVVATVLPLLQSPTVSGNNLIVSGTAGTPNWYYYILASTNLSLPLNQWTRIATNQFDSGGNFNFTNAINPSQLQTYLKLQSE